MNWIDSLLGKYSQGNSELFSSLEGAKESDILKLESAMGNRLPEEYIEFLQRCGINDGGILDNLPAHTDIKNLLLTYEESEEFPDDFPKGDWVIVGAGHSGVDFILNCKSCVVHDGCYDNDGIYYAESFKEMVQQQAFLQYRIIRTGSYENCSSSTKDIVDSRGGFSQADLYRELQDKLSEFSDVSELSDKRKILSIGESSSWYVEVNADGVVIFVSGDKYKDNLNQLSSIAAARNMRLN